jgi:hypothetical protein
MTKAYTLATYKVIPGKEAEFISVWNGLARTFSSLPNPASRVRREVKPSMRSAPPNPSLHPRATAGFARCSPRVNSNVWPRA